MQIYFYATYFKVKNITRSYIHRYHESSENIHTKLFRIRNVILSTIREQYLRPTTIYRLSLPSYQYVNFNFVTVDVVHEVGEIGR